jgi:hypothetical protein
LVYPLPFTPAWQIIDESHFVFSEWTVITFPEIYNCIEANFFEHFTMRGRFWRFAFFYFSADQSPVVGKGNGGLVIA